MASLMYIGFLNPRWQATKSVRDSEPNDNDEKNELCTKILKKKNELEIRNAHRLKHVSSEKHADRKYVRPFHCHRILVLVQEQIFFKYFKFSV